MVTLSPECLRALDSMLRFSIRALLLFTAFVAAWLGSALRQQKAQTTAVRLVRSHGGHVYYSFQQTGAGPPDFVDDASPPLLNWIRDHRAVDFFYSIAGAKIGGRPVAGLWPADAELAPIFARVRWLQFTTFPVTDRTLLYISAASELETLNIWDARRTTSVGVRFLCKLAKLKNIELVETRATDESLKALERLESLETLRLLGGSASDDGLFCLRGHSALRELSLGPDNSRVTGVGFRQLTFLQNLRKLELPNTGVDDDSDVSELSELTRLECLDLSGTRRITDGALSSIGRLKNLKELYLKNAAVSSAGLARIRSLKNLETLDLGGNERVDDTGMRHLAALPRLRQLRLDGTNVTSRGLRLFVSSKTLRWLALSGTGADSCAIENALPNCNVFPGTASQDRWVRVFIAPTRMRSLVNRMIAIATCLGADTKLPKLIVQLKQFHSVLSESDIYAVSDADDLYERLKKFEAPGDWGTRLRLAAASFESADDASHRIRQVKHIARGRPLSAAELRELQDQRETVALNLEAARDRLQLAARALGLGQPDIRVIWSTTRPSADAPSSERQ